MSELRRRDDVPARALEFIILTAARAGEALDATWDEVDLINKVWTIPASRMKAHKEHRVPLTDRVVAILEGLPRESGSDHLFLSAQKGSRLTSNTLLALAREMRPDITVHGFRSSFSDWAADKTDFPTLAVEMALAHTVGSAVERAYRRGDLFEKRRKLMDAWARYCAELPQTGAVLTFPPRG